MLKSVKSTTNDEVNKKFKIKCKKTNLKRNNY